MAETVPNPMLNPLLLPWTDFGLRALESIVSSSQSMGDQVDRAARATAAEPATGSSAATLLALSRMQWAAFEWMTQSWQQWFNAMAAFNPLQEQQQFFGDEEEGSKSRAGAPGARPKAAGRRRGSRSK